MENGVRCFLGLFLATTLIGCVSFGAAPIKLPPETDEPPTGFPREWELPDPEVRRKLDALIAEGRLREIMELAKSPVENRRQTNIVRLAASCVVERLRTDQLSALRGEFEESSPASQVIAEELNQRSSR